MGVWEWLKANCPNEAVAQAFIDGLHEKWPNLSNFTQVKLINLPSYYNQINIPEEMEYHWEGDGSQLARLLNVTAYTSRGTYCATWSTSRVPEMPSTRGGCAAPMIRGGICC